MSRFCGERGLHCNEKLDLNFFQPPWMFKLPLFIFIQDQVESSYIQFAYYINQII